MDKTREQQRRLDVRDRIGRFAPYLRGDADFDPPTSQPAAPEGRVGRWIDAPDPLDEYNRHVRVDRFGDRWSFSDKHQAYRLCDPPLGAIPPMFANAAGLDAERGPLVCERPRPPRPKGIRYREPDPETLGQFTRWAAEQDTDDEPGLAANLQIARQFTEWELQNRDSQLQRADVVHEVQQPDDPGLMVIQNVQDRYGFDVTDCDLTLDWPAEAEDYFSGPSMFRESPTDDTSKLSFDRVRFWRDALIAEHHL